MRVKALILFNDLKADRIRRKGEIFDVTEKRAGELSSSPLGFIEVLGKPIEKQAEKQAEKQKPKIRKKGGKINV